MEVKIDNAKVVLESFVKVYGTSSNGTVYVPKKYKDKKVKVVILETV